MNLSLKDRVAVVTGASKGILCQPSTGPCYAHAYEARK